jgi:hypothetical protein
MRSDMPEQFTAARWPSAENTRSSGEAQSASAGSAKLLPLATSHTRGIRSWPTVPSEAPFFEIVSQSVGSLPIVRAAPVVASTIDSVPSSAANASV